MDETDSRRWSRCEASQQDGRQSFNSHQPTAQSPGLFNTTTAAATSACDTTASTACSPSVPEAPQIELDMKICLLDDCRKVLFRVLRRYGVHNDWQAYELLIMCDNQERAVGLDEKPRMVVKVLEGAGKKPMFKPRRSRDPLKGAAAGGHSEGMSRAAAEGSGNEESR
jgi:hypothetical protein